MGAAAATFVAMMAIWYCTPALRAATPLFEHMLSAFIIGVTIVVVAVGAAPHPDGGGRGTSLAVATVTRVAKQIPP